MDGSAASEENQNPSQNGLAETSWPLVSSSQNVPKAITLICSSNSTVILGTAIVHVANC